MWITRLILINIFSSSVLGEIRVVVQYSANYNNRPTVSLTAVSSNFTIKGKRCLGGKDACGESSHVKINSGEKTECYSNTYSQTCGWGFTIEVTVTNDTFHTNLTVTRDYNPGQQLDLKVSCSGDRNVTLRIEPQTYQPVHLRWTAPSPANQVVSKFIRLRNGGIIAETNWTASIWSGIIGCSDRFGTSTQTTENETSAQTTNSVVVSTQTSDVLYTKTSVVTKNATTPRAQENETSQTTNSAVVSTKTSDVLHTVTSVVTKNAETPRAQDSSVDSLEKLLTYIIPTVGGGLILLIVIIIIVVFKKQRKRSAGHPPKSQRCPTTAEAPAETRSPNDDFDPTYDHLRDRVAVKRFNSTYELHDVPIYSQAQNVHEYRQPPEGSTNLDDEDRNQSTGVPQHSVYSSIDDFDPNLNQLTDHRNQDNGTNGEIHPDMQPTALSNNSHEIEAVETTHGKTTPHGTDLYTEVVKSKDGASSKFGFTRKPEGPVQDLYTEVVKNKKGFEPEEIDEMVQNDLYSSKD